MKIPVAVEALSKNLRRLLDERQWVDRVAGAKAGISPKTVNNMKNARGAPTLDKIEAMAKALGLTAADLIRPSMKMSPEEAAKMAGAADYLTRLRGILVEMDDTRRSQLLSAAEDLLAQQRNYNAHFEENVDGLLTPAPADGAGETTRGDPDPSVLGSNQYLPENQ